MISLLYTGLKLNSSIQIKKKRLGFLGLFMLNHILFVFFEAGFQEALQEFGERDRYPAVF